MIDPDVQEFFDLWDRLCSEWRLQTHFDPLGLTRWDRMRTMLLRRGVDLEAELRARFPWIMDGLIATADAPEEPEAASSHTSGTSVNPAT